MAEDTATLRDTVVTDSKPEPEAIAPASAEDKVPQIADAPSPEAAELGQILLSSGVTKDQLNSLLEAPKALESLRYQWENNPRGFVEMLERTAPQTGERFLEEVSSLYLDRNKHLVREDTGKPKGDSPASNELMQEVERLREQTSRLLTREQQRDSAASLAAVRQRYDARVDDMLNVKEVKEMNLTGSEVKNLKARLNQELSSDSTAVQRVNAGNFVDVPRVFQSLLKEKVDDRKAAADFERNGRERVKSNASWDWSNGPDASLLGDINKAIAADDSPDWEGTIQAMSKAMERTAR
jgi:hypothetical protein